MHTIVRLTTLFLLLLVNNCLTATYTSESVALLSYPGESIHLNGVLVSIKDDGVVEVSVQDFQKDALLIASKFLHSSFIALLATIRRYVPTKGYVPGIALGVFHIWHELCGSTYFPNSHLWQFTSYWATGDGCVLFIGANYLVQNNKKHYIPALMAFISGTLVYEIGALLWQESDIASAAQHIQIGCFTSGLLLLGAGHVYEQYREQHCNTVQRKQENLNLSVC